MFRINDSVRRLATLLLGLLLVLAACGGDSGGDDGDVGGTGGEVQSSDGNSSTGSGDGSANGDDDANPSGGGQAMATLVVGDQTHVFEGNQWTYCTIGGVFPVSVEFQREEIKWDGDWFQFVDRGDGGINFSAVFDGEEYAGTGAGEADEITSNGFTFTGSLNNQGQSYDVRLEVSC